MSTSFFTYVGAFLEVPPVLKSEAASGSTCLTTRCLQNGVRRLRPETAPYCTGCGQALTPLPPPPPTLRPLRAHDVEPPEFSDLFWSPESCTGEGGKPSVWLPNRKGYGIHCEEGSDSSASPRYLPEGTATAAMDKLRQDMGVVLSHVEEIYGVVPVVRYGIVSYWT